MIGAGGIAAVHLPGLLPLASEVVVFARRGAGDLPARFGVREAASVEELLSASDIVLIATPTPTHLDLTRAALEAGRPVILEKPVTLTRDEADELALVAERSTATVLPAHVVRWFPAYADAAARISAGEIGRPVALRFSRTGAHPSAAWFAVPERSGGVVLDLMIHDIDQARWMAGEVVAVQAVRSRLEGPGGPVEAAHALLAHSSGAVSSVSASWGSAGTAFATSFAVVGELGSLDHDSRNAVAGAGDPYAAQAAELVAALRGEGPARVTLEDGLAAVRVARAALESIDSGAAVEL